MRLGLPLHFSAGPGNPALRVNRAPQVRYSLADLPAFLPWLVRYYLASAPDRALRGAMAVLPLIRQQPVEHEALIAEAGVPELLRRNGWIKLFRSSGTLAKRGRRTRAGEGNMASKASARSKGDRGSASPT